MLGGLLQSACDEEGKNCQGIPFPICKVWLQIFLARDANYDIDTMTEDDFFRFLHISRQRFASIMGSADPDLSEFRAAGGKMITWYAKQTEIPCSHAGVETDLRLIGTALQMNSSSPMALQTTMSVCWSLIRRPETSIATSKHLASYENPNLNLYIN